VEKNIDYSMWILRKKRFKI